MQIFKEPLLSLDWYNKTSQILQQTSNHQSVRLTGMGDIEKAHIISTLAADFDAAIIIVENDIKAREMVDNYSFFDKNITFFPAKDLIFYQADINGKQMSIDRMKAISQIISGEKITIVTTIDAFMAPMPPISEVLDNQIIIENGSILELDAIAIKLVKMGYTRSAQVENKGEYAIRGGILDIYDLTMDNPVRIELWGDQIDSIRSFDVLSQRSIETLDRIQIFPASEIFLTTALKEKAFHDMNLDAKHMIETFKEAGQMENAKRVGDHIEQLRCQLLEVDMGMNMDSYITYFYDELSSLFDILKNRNTCYFLSEPEKIMSHGGVIELEFREGMKGRLEKGYLLPGQADFLNSLESTAALLQRQKICALSTLIEAKSVFSFDNDFTVSSRSISSYNGSFNMLVSDLKKLKKAGNKVLIISPSRTRAKRLSDDLMNEDVIASFTEDQEKVLQKGEIYTFYGHLKSGFEYPDAGFTVISEADIFGNDKTKKRKKPKFASGTKISGYDDLKVGDYVIHENHGLGVYKGIEKVEMDHVAKDYMKIEYKGGGNLYVLASNFDAVSLYASADAKPPRLNKLGSQEWSKTKSKVQNAVFDVAKELVHLYAVRTEKNGYQFGHDTVWQQEFEEMFPYEETEDQLNAINAAKDDMESTKIMDRLVCGDVGFGKTEVAIRTAFKAVQEGKQVAYLVPTTVLAQQHYTTFKERMSGYPVRVEMLSRFCTAKEIKKTLTDLKKGLVDIVIGTHRLLSKDVIFNDLGLLVIDEEQRFGVAHKEKIKQMKENIDVLTLTATPIPRTLHMSLIGIRDMSLLEEPPLDRLPIQTYVLEYNEEMVREAINRELARNGQVYYVYNRVNDIDLVAARISELVPNARVSFAHGQMKETELEVIMMEFVNHEIDVLVSTTIIETGLDIPNANTMIIHDSDSMGLSQLYQLRGRVGRSNRTSFAFLMYQKGKLLKDVAEKRLAAIKEFTELGSGFKIAMRDLEIRGAGNLLGKTQHGHIEAVGYDLYCKMLEDAVSHEQGIVKTSAFMATVDMDVDAYIPAEYIVNEGQKLDIYKRIATTSCQKDYDDMMDELKDRFGNVPPAAINLLRIALIKQKATDLHLTEVKGKRGRIKLTVNKNAPVIVENIPVFLYEYGGALRFQPAGEPEFILVFETVGLAERDEEILLEKTEELLEKMKMLFDENLINKAE